MKTFRLEIITLERKVYEDTVDSISLPTQMGEIGIYASHLPLITALSIGEIKIRKGEIVDSLTCSGGFAEIHPNKVTLLTDAAEHAEEIDEKRAEEARRRAFETMKKSGVAAPQYAEAVAALRRATLRLKVARKKRHGRVPGQPGTEV
ncbi:MAG: ATP synthase F1 subunit epsilon [Patescibacteria group bacterium]